jgi:hypothetical protein
MNQSCPVCSTSPTKVDQWGEYIRVQCERCGKFAVTDWVNDALAALFQEVPARASLMSHTIRCMQCEGSRVIVIHREELPTYFSRKRLPTPQEQADDLILWIGDNQPDNATGAIIKELALDAWIGAPLPKVPGNAPGLRWLLTNMEPIPTTPRNFIHAFEHGSVRFQLTLAGWGRYADLKQVRKESRIAFMAMKFSDTELNGVVDRCFRPAAERAGFELRVLTDHQRAGLIDDQIRAALLTARFVVADLTHGSFGAYWEAGFADGRGLPVIYTCKRAQWDKTKTHFDTNHMTTVIWDAGDLKSSEDEMVAIIRATLRGEAKQSDD